MAKEPKKEKMNFIHKITSILTGSCFHFHSVAPYLLALPLAIYLCFGSATLARAQEQQRALILQSYHIGFIWSDNVAEGIKSVLGKEKNVEIFFEYMDTKRHMGKPYLEKLLQLYKDKYGALSLDVIICSDDNALNFLLRNREDLFPGVPIVFCGINNFTDSLIAGYTNITCVVENPDILGTLQIALRLHPGTRQVAVVHDQSKSALANIARLRKIAPDFKEQVEFKYLTDMTISELREALRDLPAETVVLHLSFGRDRDGVFLSLREASKLVNDNSAGPVYTCWDVRMSYPGHCGGKVVSGYAQGEAAARLALRVLHGESANNIDIIRKSPNVYMFDYAQMNRFGLSKKDLPKDSIVVNKPFSFYEKYKGRIRITLGAIAFLLILISSLTVNIFRRKQAEEALRESEEKYRELINGMSDTAWVIDFNANFIDVNDAAVKVLGYSRKELLSMRPQDIDTSIGVEEIKGLIEQIPTDEIQLFETTHATKDGKTIPVEVKSSLVTYQGKQVILSIARDITERKRVEEALRESETQKRAILDASIDKIRLVDKDMRIIWANKTTARELNIAPEDLVGQLCYKAFVDRDSPCPECPTKKALETGETEHAVMHQTKSKGIEGETYWDAYTVPIKDESGDIVNLIQVSRNITDKVKAEEEQKKLQSQFQAAQRMESIGTLAGGIAHNFNNVLMGIQGNTSLILLGKTSDHPDYERLSNIEQGVLNGAELTKQLLGFAMGGRYEVLPTDLNELIKSQNRMFGRTKKEITIRGKYQDSPWTVEVDQGQINQVILNLYVNAWQAMPKGGDLYVQTENVTLDENYTKPFNVTPGRYVKISITDTGVGMDEETQRRIFEPFFTTKEMSTGTGLGLSSVYGIIKNHGGIINVYSEKGEGSTFTIYLPASEKEIVKEEKIPERLLKGTETVLLVDDEDIIIDVGDGLLKTLGYKVLIARGGKEAIEIISKAQRAKRKEDKGRKGHAPGAMPPAPDIIILDMIMPEMSGGETYDRMKEINPNIKVLLSSGYSINGQATEILERGCDGFIQKPFTIKELSNAIREVLGS